MKKKIVTHLITFIVGGLVFGSIGIVIAITYKASDISYTPSDTSWNVNTVENAINDLSEATSNDIKTITSNGEQILDKYYKNLNVNVTSVDEYANKQYTQSGLTVYSNRVVIKSGGYYTDNNGITWVNITFVSNISSTDGSALLISGFPKVGTSFIVTDENQESPFLINYNSGAIHNRIDYTGTAFGDSSLKKNTTYTLKFKYKTAQ